MYSRRNEDMTKDKTTLTQIPNRSDSEKKTTTPITRRNLLRRIKESVWIGKTKSNQIQEGTSNDKNKINHENNILLMIKKIKVI